MKCYLCSQNDLKIIRTKLRHDISRNVLKCQACGIVYLEPKGSDLKEYYQQDYRKLYAPVIGKESSSAEIFNIYFPYQKARINEIKHILNPMMKALDVGCSAGHFLYALKEHVQECVGIEFNKKDAEFVNQKLGIKTYTEPIQNTDIPLEYFDLITAYQVLEHIDDPVGFLTTVYKYLKPDGVLCVEVPNIQDTLISVYNNEPYADFWFREPHIFYFSPKTLSTILEHSGFSGTIKTVQTYNFLNHLNWILTGKPQNDADTGISQPRLVNDVNTVNPAIKKEFNIWIQKVDEEYKRLLNKHDLGESILFIGKKMEHGKL